MTDKDAAGKAPVDKAPVDKAPADKARKAVDDHEADAGTMDHFSSCSKISAVLSVFRNSEKNEFEFTS